MKENERLARPAEIKAEIKNNEPSVEILGNISEFAQRKHWFNEGPGRLDI